MPSYPRTTSLHTFIPKQIVYHSFLLTLDLKCGGFFTGLMTVMFSPTPFLQLSSVGVLTGGSGGSSTIFGCILGFSIGLLSMVGVVEGEDFDLA